MLQKCYKSVKETVKYKKKAGQNDQLNSAQPMASSNTTSGFSCFERYGKIR